MTGGVPCGGPLRVLLFELERVDNLLQCAAFAHAMLQHTRIIEKRDESRAGKIIHFLNSINPVVWAWNTWHYGDDWDFGPIFAEVRTNMPEVARSIEHWLTHARRRFFEHASRGPSEATQFLEMTRGQLDMDRRRLRTVFKTASAINDETIENARIAARRADLVRTSATAALTIGLAFVPGGVVALSAAGIAYSLACELVMQAQDVDNAEIVAFIQQQPVEPGNPADKQAADAAQTIAVNQAQNILNDQLATAAQRQAIEMEIKYARQIEEYAAQNANRNLKIRPLPRPAPVAGGAELTAAKLSRDQARVLAGTADDMAAAAANATARRTTARLVGGGAGAGIGLLFMKDDLARAFASLTAELAD